jgi:hypothetical protein
MGLALTCIAKSVKRSYVFQAHGKSAPLNIKLKMHCWSSQLSASEWEELLLPEIERQQKLGKEVLFRPTLPSPSRRFAKCWKNGREG